MGSPVRRGPLTCEGQIGNEIIAVLASQMVKAAIDRPSPGSRTPWIPSTRPNARKEATVSVPGPASESRPSRRRSRETRLQGETRPAYREAQPTASSIRIRACRPSAWYINIEQRGAVNQYSWCDARSLLAKSGNTKTVMAPASAKGDYQDL